MEPFVTAGRRRQFLPRARPSVVPTVVRTAEDMAGTVVEM